MRKMTVIISIFILLAFAAGSRTGSVQTARISNPNVELYFVDSQMLRLMKTEYNVGRVSRQKAAEKVLEELIKGRDENEKILRLIPNVKKCMTVKVEHNIAYVDLKKSFVEQYTSDERQHEILLVYSIVNSLTSVEGISNVRFTIEGKEESKLKGFIDMRETFIPDYLI
ncbi:MAG TPA: GerMN domain-containing protein [Candidatus Avimonoglobus intestinipullorum]|uniref:GerMN domain-containing protein n=1 Tax=Candidatus Avimonoglobus intestinipullorum TaxID=2840699 RepID=A0A9D1LVF3_9FIRM|nr:GerMN domain-containing protein [Candidatus Avimonoglobus intestinipullorum]